MPVKHCCYGDCNSDSRYVGIKKEMDNVYFIPFPKPKTQKEKCERWVRLCGRKYFTVENIRKETYMCSKHFVGGKGPTKEHPDPLPALATSYEKKVLSSKRKRKSPVKRPFIKTQQKRKKLQFESSDEDEDASSAAFQSTHEHMPHSIPSDHSYSSTNIQPHECQGVSTTDTSLVETEMDEICTVLAK